MPCRFSIEAQHLEATPVDNTFLLEYMPRASHIQLRVYLLGLMQCRYPGFADLSLDETLGCREEDVIDAFAYWQREGLVRVFSAEPLEIEYLSPIQRATQPMLVPGRHSTLVQAVQALFAPRTLKSSELRRLYDWVEVFQLEPDAIVELVTYCLNRKGTAVGIKYIDTVARNWANAGVRTAEDARTQAQSYEERTGGAAVILQQMGLAPKPSKDQLAIYEKWTNEWGFSLDAILAACPALLNAERPNFAYLDGVLNRLQQENVLDAVEITARFTLQAQQASTAQQVFTKMGLARTANLGQRKELQDYLDAGLSLEILLYLAEQAADRVNPLAQFRRLAKNCAEQGAVTFEQAQEVASRCTQAQSGGKKTPDAMNYTQKQYSQTELQHVYISLDSEKEEA